MSAELEKEMRIADPSPLATDETMHLLPQRFQTAQYRVSALHPESEEKIELVLHLDVGRRNASQQIRMARKAGLRALGNLIIGPHWARS